MNIGACTCVWATCKLPVDVAAELLSSLSREMLRWISGHTEIIWKKNQGTMAIIFAAYESAEGAKIVPVNF